MLRTLAKISHVFGEVRGANIMKVVEMNSSLLNTTALRCDGWGQLDSREHIARRLRRLEWTTRFRPVHIGTLLFGAVAPQNDSEFIYSPGGGWGGEAEILLAVAGLTIEGKTTEATLGEFQRRGFFLTHVLECPLEKGEDHSIQQLIRNRLPTVLARIRRSLKPKRLVPISKWLERCLTFLSYRELRCAILLDRERPFALDGDLPSGAARRLPTAASEHDPPPTGTQAV